jgi:hypothetical protein
MGFFLRKRYHGAGSTVTTSKPATKIRPSIQCIRARLMEVRERLWYIDWKRNGEDPALAGAAKAIRKRYGKDKTCSCETCVLRTRTILAVLAWAVGETNDFE